MTKKQFKYDMQRGLGSCILALKESKDLEKYQDIIIWGCKHDLAYDTQCEGTRSYYLYQMIQFFKDLKPFYEAVTSGVDKCISRDGWEFSQHVELLAFMACGGYEPAIKKLDEGYFYLLNFLMCHRNHHRKERENLEAVCLAFISCSYDNVELIKKKYIDIVNDLGRLFVTKTKQYSFYHFEWFQSHSEDVLGKNETESLLRKYCNLEGVKGYLESRKQYLNEKQEITHKNAENNTFYSANNLYQMIKEGKRIGNGLPRLTPFYMKNPKRRIEVDKLSGIYETEPDEAVRIELLKLLGDSFQASFGNVEKLIADSKSENEQLSEAAFRVLCNIKEERVHEYALELIRENRLKYMPYIMLIRNYQPREMAMIIELVKSVPISSDGNWHEVFFAVQDLFKDKDIKEPPKELLFYIYKNTLCSTCREYVVTEMGRRRMLTKEILEECCFDCNNDIRVYAHRKLEKICKKEKEEYGLLG